jgi:hypothetical protein
MWLKAYQLGELVGIFFLLAATAMQMFYLEPLKREIEWRLVAFNTQQSARIQANALYQNHVEMMKLMKAPEDQVAAAEARRDKTLDAYKSSDANISDFVTAKEDVENYLEVFTISLFAIGSMLAGLGRALEMLSAHRTVGE